MLHWQAILFHAAEGGVREMAMGTLEWGGGAMRNGGWRLCDGEQGMEGLALGNGVDSSGEWRNAGNAIGEWGGWQWGSGEMAVGKGGLGAEGMAIGKGDWEQREMAMGGWGYGNGETGLGAGGVAMGKLKGEQADLKAVTGTFIHAQRHVNDVLKVLPRDQICP